MFYSLPFLALFQSVQFKLGIPLDIEGTALELDSKGDGKREQEDRVYYPILHLWDNLTRLEDI